MATDLQLSHLSGQEVTKITEDDSGYKIWLESGAVIHTNSKRQLPELKGKVLTTVAYDEKETKVIFAAHNDQGTILLSDSVVVKLNALKYELSMLDVDPVNPQQPDEAELPPDPSAERTFDGPQDEDGDEALLGADEAAEELT